MDHLPQRLDESDESYDHKSSFAISRRTFLEGSAGVASLVSVGATITACETVPVVVSEPWTDGTLWHDDTGWVD